MDFPFNDLRTIVAYLRGQSEKRVAFESLINVLRYAGLAVLDLGKPLIMTAEIQPEGDEECAVKLETLLISENAKGTSVKAALPAWLIPLLLSILQKFLSK